MSDVRVHKYRHVDVQSPVTHDSDGNVKRVQIRGTKIIMGDDASTTADHTVTIGDGVSSSMTGSVAIGANSTKLVIATAQGTLTRTTETNVSTGATLTAAQVGGNAVIDISAGGVGNLTLPTAASLDAYYTSVETSIGWVFFINNNAGGAVTLVGNTGTTLDADTPSTTAIANGDSITVILRRTGSAAYSARVVGRVQGGGSPGVIVAGAGANSFMYTGATGAAGAASQAMGLTASSAGDNSIAIGRDATSSADSAIAIGYASDATVANAIAIGGDSLGANGAQATSTGAIAIGRTSVASNTQSVAIGVSSAASGVNSVCIGQISTATGQGTITIGTSATGSADNAICIGRVGDATANAAIAIGCGAQATAQEAIAIGGDSGELTPGAANATGIASIAIGTNSLSSGIDSIAFGSSAEATSQGAISIGQGVTNATGNTINLGTNNTVYSKIHSSALVQEAGYAVGNASYVSTADTAPTLNSALPFHPGTILVGAPTVGRAYTLDTGTNYDTQFPQFANNDSFTFSIVNNGVDTITLTAAAGSTISGTATVAADFTRVFQLQKTGVATWVATSLDVLSHLAGAGGSGVVVAGAGTNSMRFTTATAAGNYTVSLGDGIALPNVDSIGIGRIDTNNSDYGIAIGKGTLVSSATAGVAIGCRAVSGGTQAIAIGGDNTDSAPTAYLGAQAAGNQSIAIGAAADALNASCIGIGYQAVSSANYNMAIGDNASATTGNYQISIGKNCSSTASSGIAIGNRSTATASEAIAIGGDSADVAGAGADATAAGAIAIGTNATASASYAIGIGGDVQATAQYALAIGQSIQNAIANSVHLGGGGVSCLRADGAAIYTSVNNEGNGFLGYGNSIADIGTGNKTLTLAQMSPGAFLWTSATDTMGASANWTTPSGADLTNRYSWCSTGCSFDFEIYNVNSSLMGGQIIMVAGTTVVLSGTTTVNAGNARKYRCRKTSGATNEWTVYGLYEWTPVSR